MKIKYFALIICMLFGISSYAQDVAQDDIAHYEDEVRDMVGFLEYMLNTLGNASTYQREKDIIITQSYEKVFRDNKVQIEDDLDENRDVITNKDVSAYLKDVDFFYKDVKFDFEIEEITHETNVNGNLFFKVKMLRNLKGLTIDNDSVNNTVPRYVEVNYNPENQDLKIVSIYTNKYSQKKALKSWWVNLSLEWRMIFKQKYEFNTDSLSDAEIKQIAGTDTLDVSDNRYIISIDALSNLTDLKWLSLKNTNIKEVTALRNLTSLEYLDLSETAIDDVTPLKYCRSLETLKLNDTPITQVEVVQNMLLLKKIDLSNTPLFNTKPLGQLKKLESLNIKSTKVTALEEMEGLERLKYFNASQTSLYDIKPLAGWKALEKLYLDSTNITSLKSLGGLSQLQVLSVNNTSIQSLEGLQDLKNLTNLYCDNAPLLLSSDVNNFAKSHPNVLIVYASQDNRSWWISLNNSWRKIFMDQLQIGENPSKEALARISTIDSINLSGNSKINSLEPLKKLTELEYINASKTTVDDIQPLAKLRQLKYLDVSFTGVYDLQPLHTTKSLEELHADSTQIVDLSPLNFIDNLKRIYANNTPVSWKEVNTLIDKNPDVLVIFRTSYLQDWWKSLNSGYKTVFEKKIDGKASSENLHQLTQQESLNFSGPTITQLDPLEVFIRLTELKFNNTGISSLAPLIKHTRLKTLEASSSPVQDLTPLAQLSTLEVLNIANTPVESLEALENLTDLRTLDCSGTQIKRLNDLELLHGLEELNCSNTRVKRLDPVQYLSLKNLVCYNTRISDNRMEDFKAENPDCEVTFY